MSNTWGFVFFFIQVQTEKKNTWFVGVTDAIFKCKCPELGQGNNGRQTQLLFDSC